MCQSLLIRNFILTSNNSTLYSSSLQKDLSVVEKNFDKSNQRTLLTFEAPLPENSDVELSVKFKGELGNSMTGYYRSSWEDEGITKYYALTQFEVCFRTLLAYYY
jgi:aminopeptidase 2